MKFGVNTWVWISPTTTDQLKSYIPKVKEMGFDLIEFAIEDIGLIDYPRVADMLQTYEMDVAITAAMGPDRDLIIEDEAIQKNGMAYLKHCIDACATLGGANLVGPMYSAVGRVWEQTSDSRKRDSDLLVKQLSDLAAYAGDKGVRLGVEPLNRFETSFLNTAAQTIEIIDRVDHPACKIMLDSFHMNVEEKSLGDAIRATGERLIHFHSCENDRGAPGSGNVNWDEVAAALKEIQFDGPVVIESFTNQVKSIARAAAIWRPFESSQDALAENGVTFLKELFV
ncbi:MAG: sugar phosphate isomerase/epimerase family protein [Chloroflexota bacterium]